MALHPLPTIDAAPRRARLAIRHHLAPSALATSPVEAARDLVGLHATDPASVYLGAHARTKRLDVPTMESALYDERSLLKILGMRRTMFVVPLDLAAVIQAACTRAIALRERKRLIGMIEGAGFAKDPRRWLEDVEAATVEALEARGEAVATELTKDVPGLREQIAFGAGKKWQGTMGMSTRVLFLLSMEGRIIRARPRGSWLSSQYRWAPVEGWLDGGLTDWPTEAAQVELVRRWLAAYGPGTVRDIQWWTGWTLGETRRALAEIETAEVELDGTTCDGGAGTTGLVLANDLEPVPEPRPWVALLPALDSTVMGWAARDWFLGPHRPALFDTNGNAGPTIWWGGRVVGGWGQMGNGEVVVRLLEDVGAEGKAAVDAAAHRTDAWLGGVRITPRFRTPLEKELGGLEQARQSR